MTVTTRRPHRGIRAGAALAAVALVAGGWTAQGSTSARAAGPHRGGSLTFGEFVGVTSLDPARLAGYAAGGGSEGAAIYGELMRLDTKTDHFVPDLAKSLTHNKDYSTWTLKLRPNVHFTDGTPYNAAAVVTNFQRDLNPGVHATVTGLLAGFIKSVTAANPTTVVFSLKQPWAGFAYTLSYTPGMIAAPSYLSKLDAGDTTATPIGAGPFEVSSFRPGEELTLTRNDHYALGAPYLDSLKFVLIPGGIPTLQAFDVGQLQAALLYDPTATKQAAAEHVPNLSSLSPLNSIVLVNNRAGSPLANPLLREALALGINPSFFNQRVYQGAGLASSQLFPKGSHWYTPSAKGVPYNPAKAKALVAQVKAKTGWNGNVRFLCGNEPGRGAIPVALEAMLQPLGINLQVTNDIPTSQVIIQVIVQRDFDLACWGEGVQDPAPFPGLWLALDSVSPNNFAGYSSPKMDAALGELRVAATAKAKEAALAKINRIWNQTWPSVDLGAVKYMVIHKPNVHGLVLTLGSVTLFDKAWLS